jgi:glycerate kinase
LDAGGHELLPGGAALADLVRLDLTGLREQLAGVRVVVASDVTNPLLGPDGAAAVFGPQKGADAGNVKRLEAALAVWARVVADATGTDLAGRPGAGAAGGTGFAALALLDAELRPGIDLVLDLVGFAAAVAGADLVITGEGSLDEQSLAGKAPYGVAQAASRAGVPVVAVAGRNLLGPDQLRAAGIHQVYPLAELEPDLERCVLEAPRLLGRVGGAIVDAWVAWFVRR